jgi:glycerol kinase
VKPTYILALDQGTTSSRAIVFDARGMPVGQAQKEFPQIYPKPGWVEHDPEAIWDSQLDTAREALARAAVSPEALAGIGVTNQRETTILWDRGSGRPVYHAIVWQCRRTADACEKIKAEGKDRMIREKTGLVTDAYFSATKVAWLLDNVPGLRRQAERGEVAFGTVDTFLIWRLTGGKLHVTDASNASRTMLYNIYEAAWDSEILDYLRIPSEILPQVRPSSCVYGKTEPSLLGAAVPIAGAAGDQQAATFGQACYRPGTAKNTYGTGCFLLLNTGPEAVRSTSGLLTTIGWQLADGSAAQEQSGTPSYCLEGSVFIGGAAVQWLRDGLGVIRKSEEVEALAASVKDNHGVYFVPAFVGLGAPYWDPYARGTITGLTRGATSGHLARATLEAIAYQSRDVIEAMKKDADIELEALRVDGGAAKNDLLMQFQADLLNVPVQRPVIHQTTALGAAYLAGLAVGLWPSTETLMGLWTIDREFLPRMPRDQREELYAGWKRAVLRARGDSAASRTPSLSEQ